MSKATKVRWGILSTADIGMTKVTPAIMKSEHCEVTAICSRDLARARSAADKLGIEKAYGTYEEMLADPEIDAIYNPLPNHRHVEMTIAANAAGKHVLCEKPIALSAQEAKLLRGCRSDALIMEGFMVRFHAQWLRAREIARSGELGDVRAVRAVFSYFNDDPDNVRNMAEIGGGAILDIGCYPVTGGRFFFECEPERVIALIDRDPRFGTDRQASVIADFGKGRQLVFLVSTQLVNSQSIEIFGTKGRVEIVIPYNAPQDEATALIIDQGLTYDGYMSRREILAPSDQYTEMANAFALAVLGKAECDYGIEDAINSMHVLDAIFESERTGTWVQVEKGERTGMEPI
ncbi:Gfo/Idh/MocA family oxidoreductase [Pelagibacterium flavum]|uniref:Gfo/Idh/MocA family oxidoreductase n=1 Tax=Pelagibacterium flavum TaxID=2984530 RepID=A0ABY6IKL2_9HYPH|nr:Gfo/Idh/MocA family oxidoreductase [Pelagibacterium sp. YIM 151497]UYQ71133.1 Gfo/Idh/MocA family oxidoreductase [Pelagibacterium sp. YIM 151497]